ncbi:MAG: sensor histidine kinase [Flavobacteriaceae bacterium]|nr:sensor histidine kinase [Flavobacteriaceae bacterium]
MLKKEEILLILYLIAVVFFLAAFVVIFLVAFQRRKNKLLLEKYEAQQRFQQELASSRLEIQEQTFKNIAWELHDNVGQLLSVANLQLNMLLTAPVDDLREQIGETKDVIVATVEEVRSLSKTLNTEVVLNNGLVESVKTELERFNRLNFLHADLKIEGEETVIKKEDEIIIFRILQEFFSNVIKHAKANKLFVHLGYDTNQLQIVAEDDGEGFDTTKKSGNSGLQNMKSRASLLGADLILSSQPGDGTQLRLTYPYPIYE